ncbi:MAG TPA: hypothetical protein VG308_17995 [Stellaceae bacterium]|jgi:hypothetical protein|nr:hypothetical protein [Stellaceae bacterium]
MLLSWPGAGRLAAFAVCVLAALPAAADEVGAIVTPGQGELTMCPYSGCNLYHHIKLPPHIAVGDKVRVHFGSNPKSYRFPVVRIVRDGDHCVLFSQTAETKDIEKIEVASCRVAPQAQ